MAKWRNIFKREGKKGRLFIAHNLYVVSFAIFYFVGPLLACLKGLSVFYSWYTYMPKWISTSSSRKCVICYWPCSSFIAQPANPSIDLFQFSRFHNVVSAYLSPHGCPSHMRFSIIYYTALNILFLNQSFVPIFSVRERLVVLINCVLNPVLNYFQTAICSRTLKSGDMFICER